MSAGLLARARSLNRGLVERLDDRFFPGVRDSWDEWLLRDRVLAALRPDSILLDFGAGRGASPTLDFRGACARICGVDVDPAVLENPHVHEARVAADSSPYPDEHFDVVMACNVLEHLDDPAPVFREIARVLVPGGRLLVKTPNRWHYMPLIASVTPQAFHVAYNALRGRAEHDTFPTRYRANTARRLRRLAQEAGLVVRRIERVESRPEYMRWLALLYPIGLAYERLVNLSPRLEIGRAVMIGELERR
jgi:SAM-dependent methyltransferase